MTVRSVDSRRSSEDSLLSDPFEGTSGSDCVEDYLIASVFVCMCAYECVYMYVYVCDACDVCQASPIR